MLEQRGPFTFRRRRVLLENLTAWLFLAPAGAIIFLFGIFPVTFAFFVSLHRWRRFPDDFRGLDSYVKAMGNFAYVVFFWLSLALLLLAAYTCWRLWRECRRAPGRAGWILPGVAGAGALIALFQLVLHAFARRVERACASARPGDDPRPLHRRVFRQLSL